MEDRINRDMAVFQQVCEANDLDPAAIKKEAQERFMERLEPDNQAERLIWTALDHRASALIRSVTQEASLIGQGQQGSALYSIDGDPAAPAFVINEEAIRRQYGSDNAERIIEALGQVQLPVTG